MTVRTITGTYTAGYTLATTFTGLVVASTAVVGAATGSAGTAGTTATAGGPGGIGVTIGFAAPVTNFGKITGGTGGVTVADPGPFPQGFATAMASLGENAARWVRRVHSRNSRRT